MSPFLDPRTLWENGRAVLSARYHLRSAARLGKAVRIWGTPVVKNSGRLIVGERVRIESRIVPVELAVESDGTLEIGERTFINYGCSIAATLEVRIGARCRLGTYVMLMDNDFHRLEPERRDERPPSQPIVLGENVWLGARVIVLRGVTIGADSVIGAGSVVVADIPPGVIAAGIPAKVIRPLRPGEPGRPDLGTTES